MPPLDLYARVRFSTVIAHETAGAARIRFSLRPLFVWRAGNRRKTRALSAPRECGRTSCRRCLIFESELRLVIACDKRKAFAQGSACDEAIQLCRDKDGLLRGACHRAR